MTQAEKEETMRYLITAIREARRAEEMLIKTGELSGSLTVTIEQLEKRFDEVGRITTD